jgi:hypothetical protein
MPAHTKARRAGLSELRGQDLTRSRLPERACVIGRSSTTPVSRRDALAVDAEVVGQPQRDQSAVQAVLEREPRAEVPRQTQGGDQLRASDLSTLRRCG